MTRSTPPHASPQTAQTTLGPTLHVRGRISGEEDLRVEGRIDGSIELTQTLIVEQEGVVLAEVAARDVVVRGIVIGNVTATDSVTLEAGAKLMGDIEAPRVILADGAAFKGSVKVTGAVPRPARRRAHVSAARTSNRGTSVVGGIPRVRAARPHAPLPKEDEPTVVVKRPDVAAPEAGARGSGAQSPKKAPPRRTVAPSSGTPSSARKTTAKKTPAAKKKARPKVPARKKRKVTRR